MKSSHHYYFTDVFAQGRYTGNQLATFLDGQTLSSQEMQKIAREINFSETTFILSDRPKNGGYDVRIFTPGGEVDFAGHPTLGTAFIIQKHIVKQEVERITLNLKVGQVPVLFPRQEGEDGILWMEQVQPSFGKSPRRSIVAKMLSISVDDLDPRWPVEEVSTGLPHTIIPLKSLIALKKVRIDLKEYEAYCQTTTARVVLAFSPEGYTAGQSLAVRVFPLCYGIAEDPATGSGNGCLAAYLVKNKYFSQTTLDIETGQGYEIGRPSSLFLQGIDDNGRVRVRVGGRVVPVARGTWG